MRFFPKTEKAHVAYAGILAVMLIVAANFGAFVGHRCIPWDFLDHHYNEYLTALHAAHHGIFGAYNPYEFGGMFLPNLFAYYDPVFWWPAFFFHASPDLYQHQFIHLAHFFIIPASLFFLGHLYGVRGRGYYPIAVLSVIAVYVGPTFELMSQGGESETYCWGFAIIAALECYRQSHKLWAIVAAALFVSWATIASNEDMAFWPFALLAYALAFWPELAAKRRFLLDVGLAVAITVVLTLPYFLIEFGLFKYVLVTGQAITIEAATVGSSIAFFGYNNGISMLALPGALFVLLAASLARETARARWILGIALGALFLYALGNVTPFEKIFRTIYYPASLFRRPYGALDIALPVTFAFIVRGYFSVTGPLIARYWFAGIASAAFVASLILQPQEILVSVLAFALTLAAIWCYQSRAIVAGVLLAQWVFAIYIPIRTSEFYPGAWPPVQLTYFNDYKSVVQYMAPITPDSDHLFRVAGIGVPADFGAKSGVYRYPMLYPGHGTLMPAGVAAVVHAPEIANDVEGTRNLTAETIVGTVTANPDLMVGSESVRQMSVRYYIIGPMAANVFPTLLHDHPEFKVLNGGFWSVLYDPKAQPFVRSLDAAGKTKPVRANVEYDHIEATVPSGARYLDVADLYDNWWHASTARGEQLPVVNNGGMLRIDVAAHAGDAVLLKFENRWLKIAMILELLTYAGIACTALASVAYRKKHTA